MRVQVLIDWLEHDGRRRQPGEILELSPAAAEHLVAAGAVEPLPDRVDLVVDLPEDEPADDERAAAEAQRRRGRRQP